MANMYIYYCILFYGILNGNISGRLGEESQLSGKWDNWELVNGCVNFWQKQIARFETF